MLLGGKCWYTNNGEQRSRGLFLMIFDNIGASKSRDRIVPRESILREYGSPTLQGELEIKTNDIGVLHKAEND